MGDIKSREFLSFEGSVAYGDRPVPMPAMDTQTVKALFEGASRSVEGSARLAAAHQVYVDALTDAAARAPGSVAEKLDVIGQATSSAFEMRTDAGDRASLAVAASAEARQSAYVTGLLGAAGVLVAPLAPASVGGSMGYTGLVTAGSTGAGGWLAPHAVIDAQTAIEAQNEMEYQVVRETDLRAAARLLDIGLPPAPTTPWYRDTVTGPGLDPGTQHENWYQPCRELVNTAYAQASGGTGEWDVPARAQEHRNR